MSISATTARFMTWIVLFGSIAAVSCAGAETTGQPRTATEQSSKFTAAQREFVQSWIREMVPGSPATTTAAAADRFLDELQRRFAGDFDRLTTADFPRLAHQSMLCRALGAELMAPTHAALREEVARRRIEGILAGEAGAKVPDAHVSAGLMEKIKSMASVHAKRLVEGRMEDDDLVLLLKKARESSAPAAPAVAAKPKVLTAGDIVSEYARRNQEGAAWQRIRAITIHSRLKNAGGEEMDVFLFKMRPDRFRLALVLNGRTRLLVGGDGEKHWQQIAGHPSQVVSPKEIGQRRYLGEFADPMVDGEGATFERLADGTEGDAKIFRIAVRRSDGSRYVAWIDAENFRQVGREAEEKLTIRYSDFRTVSGVTMAFREESTDAEGRKNVLTVTRVTANPGLVQAFFEMPATGKPSFFELERFGSAAPLARTK